METSLQVAILTQLNCTNFILFVPCIVTTIAHSDQIYQVLKLITLRRLKGVSTNTEASILFGSLLKNSLFLRHTQVFYTVSFGFVNKPSSHLFLNQDQPVKLNTIKSSIVSCSEWVLARKPVHTA